MKIKHYARALSLAIILNIHGSVYAQSNVDRSQVVSIDRQQVFGKQSPAYLNMVKINPGQFQMGSPHYESKRERTEGPVQDVAINYPFEVGKFEVTFAEWDLSLIHI